MFTYNTISMVDMDVEKAIRNRRAVYPKLFSGEEVPQQYVDQMLELANYAPTHKTLNLGGLKFLVVNQKKILLAF